MLAIESLLDRLTKRTARSVADEHSRPRDALKYGPMPAQCEAEREHRQRTGNRALLQDIRFGFRQLITQRGFAALAIISMARPAPACDVRCARTRH